MVSRKILLRNANVHLNVSLKLNVHVSVANLLFALFIACHYEKVAFFVFTEHTI